MLLAQGIRRHNVRVGSGWPLALRFAEEPVARPGLGENVRVELLDSDRTRQVGIVRFVKPGRSRRSR